MQNIGYLKHLYFKALLSHRYGSRPLKAQIDKNEFELIKSEAQTDVEELPNSFYEFDDNDICNKKYKLKNLNKILQIMKNRKHEMRETMVNI